MDIADLLGRPVEGTILGTDPIMAGTAMVTTTARGPAAELELRMPVPWRLDGDPLCNGLHIKSNTMSRTLLTRVRNLVDRIRLYLLIY